MPLACSSGGADRNVMGTRDKPGRQGQPCVSAVVGNGLVALAYEVSERSRAGYVTELFLIVTIPWFFPLGIRKYVILVISVEFLQMTNTWRISEWIGRWSPEQGR